MTQDEIIALAMEAEFVSHGKPSEEDSELFVCTDKDILRFAKLVAERALADPMREVQRIGQAIEQEPPQRTWVGLTGEDVVKAYDDYQSGIVSAGFMGAVRAIEAKLKEKNT